MMRSGNGMGGEGGSTTDELHCRFMKTENRKREWIDLITEEGLHLLRNHVRLFGPWACWDSWDIINR